MARRLRLQFPGALYHVFNRGNYRRDVFESAGAAQAFVTTLGQASTRYRWRVHAYVVMRNHYHFALETPEANLVAGMHWLQSTFCIRFNRFRSESGHLFQGRYQTQLVQDDAALVRVIDYIHLNPIRAGIVQPGAAETYGFSSLPSFLAGTRPAWLGGDVILAQLKLADTLAGRAKYLEYLTELGRDPEMREQQRFGQVSGDWAVGTTGWRRALAQRHAEMAIVPGLESKELREIGQARWQEELNRVIVEWSFSPPDDVSEVGSPAWKVAVAAELRRRVAAPYRWIADALSIDRPASLRMQVHRRLLRVSA